MNNGAPLTKKRLFWQQNIIAVAIMYSFTTVQQIAPCIAKLWYKTQKSMLHFTGEVSLFS